MEECNSHFLVDFEDISDFSANCSKIFWEYVSVADILYNNLLSTKNFVKDCAFEKKCSDHVLEIFKRIPM